MHRILLRLWEMPWPPTLRRWAVALVMVRWVERLVVPQFSVGVTGLIQNDHGELLLVRHTYRHDYPWGLPGGFVEHGEQPAAALKRELREEAGFRVELSPVLEAYVDSERPLLVVVFAGTYRGGSFVSSSEVSAASFFARDRLPNLLPDQLRLVQTYAGREVQH